MWEEVGLLAMDGKGAFRKVQAFICSIRDFAALLNRERARADRAGSEFSLVVFPLERAQRAEPILRLVQTALRRRIRSIDEIGWLQDHLLAVLLPSTGVEGARFFAADFIRGLPEKIGPLSYQLFTYPGSWFPEDIWRKLGKKDGEGTTPTRLPAGKRNHQPRAGRAPDAKPGSRASRLIERKVEDVLVKPLPRWKRALDLAGAAIAIVACAPLFLLISGFILVASPGPILFRQTRVGYKGRPFTFLKFRTMRAGNDTASHREHLRQLIHSEAAMTKLDSSEDPRIIPGAKLLRKACLDELPQLFNVLKGEMSLVGPRPCIPYEAEEYERWHAGRFDVQPGLTGLWQVSGKNKLTFQQMIRLDIAYAASMNLLRDLWILLRTVPAIAGFVLEAIGKRFGNAGLQIPSRAERDSPAS